MAVFAIYKKGKKLGEVWDCPIDQQVDAILQFYKPGDDTNDYEAVCINEKDEND